MNDTNTLIQGVFRVWATHLLMLLAIFIVSVTTFANDQPSSFNEHYYENRYGINPDDPSTTIVYVRKLDKDDNEENPEGSNNNPFHDLQAASDAAGMGGVIYVLQSPSALGALDGGVVLQDGQMLLGLGPSVSKSPPNAARALITNSGGYGVLLATDNTIENLHISGTDDSGIRGVDSDGAVIRSNQIEGHNAGEHGLTLGRVDENKPTGIALIFSDAGPNFAVVEGNTIRDALANAMILRAQDDTLADFVVTHNVVDNIFGGVHADGAVNIRYLSGASGSVLFADNLIDNVGGNADSLTTSAWDAGTELDVLVDSCQILNTNQAGLDFNVGQQGLISQSLFYGTVRLAVQNTDIIGIKGVGLWIENFPEDPHTNPLDPSYIDMDLGGGPYGSVGQNRFIGNGKEFMKLFDAVVGTNLEGSYMQFAGGFSDSNVIAKHNWWGSADAIPPLFTLLFDPEPAPAHTIVANVSGVFYYPPKFRSTFDASPQLTSDPRD